MARTRRSSTGDAVYSDIYYDDAPRNLYKFGMAYGEAAWRDFAGDLTVAHIGLITKNLEAFAKVCDRIIFEGPKLVRIHRASGG